MATFSVKYRTVDRAAIRPIKLTIPGWPGQSRDHGDGALAQPWHCPPFVEGSTYGLELIFPLETEIRVESIDGRLQFHADHKAIAAQGAAMTFAQFAPSHYGMNACVDAISPPGHVVRIEPHPSFFTDQTGTIPCAVIGNLQTIWWPQFFFVVFKAPPPGHIHIFSPGQPYAQILFVPQRANYELTRMTDQEFANRQRLADQIKSNVKSIAKNIWTDRHGGTFADTYKVLAAAYAKGGTAEVAKVAGQAQPCPVEVQVAPAVRAKKPAGFSSCQFK
jgi:hypothetical protein